MMRNSLCFLCCAVFASSALAAVPKGGAKYVTDSGTVGFLRRHLLSGGDIHYPAEAARLKQQGSGFFLMQLRPEGTVESITIRTSTGFTALDKQVTETLRGYRFKPKTKEPLTWLVSFLQPATVIVKVYSARS